MTSGRFHDKGAAPCQEGGSMSRWRFRCHAQYLRDGRVAACPLRSRGAS